MKPYQERVILEQQALVDNIIKLEAYLKNIPHEAIDVGQLPLMIVQLEAMNTYNQVLKERIKLFI